MNMSTALVAAIHAMSTTHALSSTRAAFGKGMASTYDVGEVIQREIDGVWFPVIVERVTEEGITVKYIDGA